MDSAEAQPHKIVLMTGTSSGVIGVATAKRLALDPEQRFFVVATVTSLSGPKKDQLEAAVGAAIGKTLVIKQLDVCNDEQITEVVDDVIKSYSRIDILLHAAGLGTCGFIDTMPRERIERTFNVNTIGVIRATQAVLPHMKRQRAGKIITVTSLSGKVGSPFLEIFSASKFATEGFLESIAPVARQFNIRVSMVGSGLVKTLVAEKLFSYLEGVGKDESLGDDDRRYIHDWVDSARTDKLVELADVVSVIMEIVDHESPVLRYQVPRDLFSGQLGEALCDFSGEKLVARNERRIGLTD